MRIKKESSLCERGFFMLFCQFFRQVAAMQQRVLFIARENFDEEVT